MKSSPAMRMQRSFLVYVFLMFFAAGTLSAAGYDGAVDKVGLRAALDQYTSCNADCAVGLSGALVDVSIDQALDLVAAVPKLGSETNKKMRVALFYTLIRRAYERGEKVVSSYGACSNKCDALNQEIVALGRSGALGPLLKGDKVDPRIFDEPGVLKAYETFVVPVDPKKLPWQFYNEAWWKKVQSTA